jgi:Ni/Co efflux regulator RcnB
MHNTKIKTASTLVLLVAGLLCSSGAMADKPDWANGGKHGKAERSEGQDRAGEHSQRESNDRDERNGGHFRDDQRSMIHNYYSGQYRAGHCPPGLAKKHNGCMPPGQARKWSVGRPLPRNVIFYNLPPAINIQLGAAPAGHRYVRVASDILLIAIGTGMVIDAIQNIGRM